MDVELNELNDEGLTIGQGNYGDDGNEHGGNGVEDPPMGIP